MPHDSKETKLGNRYHEDSLLEGTRTVLSCSTSTIIHTWFLVVCVAAIGHKNHFFHLYQQNKGKEKRGSSYKLAIVAKRFLKLPKCLMIEEKKSITL